MKKKGLFTTFFMIMLLCAGTVFAEIPLRPAYTFSGDQLSGEYVDGEILVVLEGPASISSENKTTFEAKLLSSANSLAASIGAQTVQTYNAIAVNTSKNIVHLRAEGKTTKQLLASLEGVSGVLGASPNYISKAIRTVPNDTNFADLWGMERIKAPEAWDVSTGSSEVFVAVVDTGIDYTHPDIAANMGRDNNNRFGIDTINNDNDPMDDNVVDGGHGTHVSGTIGAIGNNSVGVTGVCWNVKLLGVKVLDADGSGNTATIIAGLNYIVDQKNAGLNIRAVNLSLGGWQPIIASPETDPYGISCKAISDVGIVLVVAAGNDGQNIDNPTETNHPIYGDLRNKRPYPASFQFSNMITVANMTEANVLRSDSEYSTTFVHLAAPGNNILSTSTGGGYVRMGGTSMAAPHVAGAAALIAARHPTETAGQIKARILNNVSTNPNITNQVMMGGHLDVDSAIRGGSPTPPPGPVPATGISVTPTRLTLSVGQTAEIIATLIPANASNQNVTWTTSNQSVVDGAVSGTTARVTGMSSGTATLTVTTEDGGFTATCTVTVGGGGGGSGGGGCTVGAGATIPAVLLLMVPLAMLLKRK